MDEEVPAPRRRRWGDVERAQTSLLHRQQDARIKFGYGDDPRLGFALDLLKKTRRKDGRWNLDAVQPDWSPEDAPKVERYRAEHPNKRLVPLVFEAAGRPSKMITLRGLTVLSPVD